MMEQEKFVDNMKKIKKIGYYTIIFIVVTNLIGLTIATIEFALKN